MDPGFAEVLYTQILESHIRNKNDHINSIRDFRLVFEHVFRKLTEGEAQVFSNTFQRVVFVIDKYGLPKALSDEIHGFRRFANSITHEEVKSVSEKNYLTYLKAVCMAIRQFSGLAIPGTLASLYGEDGGLTFSSRTYTTFEEIERVKCVVKGKGEIEIRPDGKRQFILNCEDEGEAGIFKLVIRADEKNCFGDLHPMVRNYSTLNLIRIRKDPMQQNTYVTGPETRIVLEPDFLVDATDIAECFQRNGANYLLYFLGKLVDTDPGEGAFKGKIVNEHLDSLLKTPEKEARKVFQEAVEANAMQAARFGNDTMEQIRKDIEQNHFGNLKKIAGQLSGRKIRIEPAFFSSLYGLQGRLDVLTEDVEQETRKDVFELKSSTRVPGYDAWKNHKMQVACYNMLLYSTFGPGRTGSSSILYSVAASNPLRNITTNIFDEWQVLNVRNYIVDGLFMLSEKDYSLLRRINMHDFGEAPAYKADDIHAFEGAYHMGMALSKKYYEAMLSFCLKENQVAKIGSDPDGGREDSGFSALWQESLPEKLKKYNILSGLTCQRFDKASNSLELIMADPRLNHNFREGDLGIIYPHQEPIPDPLKSQILKGSILLFYGGRIIFKLRNKQLDDDYFTRHDKWIIEHDLYESNTWSVVQGLMAFMQAPEDLRELIFGLREPCFEDSKDISVRELTANQNDLLNRALKARDYFLMQGPPGTGKTSTMMVELTRQIISRTESRIVILAFTNRAVDEISARLKKENIRFLRLGGRDTDDEKALHSLAVGKDAGQIRSLILGYRVFVSTVSSFHSRKTGLFDIFPPDVLMVDEASQLTEPMVVGLLPGFRKFILIGDQKQLPAVITQSENKCRINDQELINAGIIDLRQSLFERLYRLCELKGWTRAIGMLDSHYRMHNDIAELINHYYGDRLVSMKPGQQEIEFKIPYFRNSSDPVEVLLSRSRTLFIQSGYSPTSKRHEEEARKVVAILGTLKRKFGKDFSRETVGVVTPWRAQIAQIRNLIEDGEILEKVTVDTIERFQGSERQIIIVSLAVYHQNQLIPLQSLDLQETVDRKLLVTVSRARDQIIILGFDRPLEGSRYYRDLMDRIRRNGGLVDYLESLSIFRI